MPKKIPKDALSLEQLKQHYLVEKELSDRLRFASKTERCRLYSPLYDELFRRVPFHQMLTQKENPEAQKQAVMMQVRLLERFLTKQSTFLEIGAGDCALSLEVAQLVRKVYALDVSAEITKTSKPVPDNFTLLISDGCSIPVPPASIHVAYSNQLMEHLHPDDAFEQLKNIYSAIAPGGVYICITPNRITGPYDISKYFDDVATGFHLKEYTASGLADMFRTAGFSKVRVLIGAARNIFLLLPMFPVRLAEFLLSLLPVALGRSIGLKAPLSTLRVIRLIATK